jgi:hypothetical protein
MFWAATPHEFCAAVDGWMEVHAPRRAGGPLGDEEIATLEDMKRRFPDEGEKRRQRRPD